MSGRYFLRGAYVGAGIVVCVAIAFLIGMALSYDSRCGDFFPGSAAKPCSLAGYLFGDVLAFALIMGQEFWPFVLGILFLPPPFVGCLFDRRVRGDAA